MVSLVRRMLDLHKRLPKAKSARAMSADRQARTPIEREIAATDRRIDKLVYDLYGLTKKEVGIVEKATMRQDRRTKIEQRG